MDNMQQSPELEQLAKSIRSCRKTGAWRRRILLRLTIAIGANILSVHILFGVYLWEFVTSFDFDLLYVLGKKRWTLAATSYFLTRYLGLAVWIIGVRISNVPHSINCQAWSYALSITAYGASAFTSILLLLRVSALSSLNIYIIGFLGAFYATVWATVIWGMYRSEGIYLETFAVCSAVDVESHRLNTVMAFAFDFTCLTLMLFFLIRARSAHPANLCNFMLHQGVAYAIIISTAYLFVVVILYVGVNDAISQTANCYASVVIVICATRMHRALVLYGESSLPMQIPTIRCSTTMSTGRVDFFSNRRRSEPLNIAVSVDQYHHPPTHKVGDYQMKSLESSRGNEYHLGQV